MTPSVKALREAFDHLTLEQAKVLKVIMDGPPQVYLPTTDIRRGGVRYNSSTGQWERPFTRMERIDEILGTFGVEYIPAGRNAKSPAFHYCNAGDTYATTILEVNGRFRIGCWGDIVERGNYE